MRRALTWIESRVLPRGWTDLLRQIVLLVGFYMLYGIVRVIVHIDSKLEAPDLIRASIRALTPDRRAAVLGRNAAAVFGL